MALLEVKNLDKSFVTADHKVAAIDKLTVASRSREKSPPQKIIKCSRRAGADSVALSPKAGQAQSSPVKAANASYFLVLLGLAPTCSTAVLRKGAAIQAKRS